MSLDNRVTQINRSQLRASNGGGSVAMLFWGFDGPAGSGDGDTPPFQWPVVWNCRVVAAFFMTTADPGLTVIGLHTDRNIVADVTVSVTPTGANVVTAVNGLINEYVRGGQLSVSVDPTNDPVAGAIVLQLENNSP